MGSQTNEAAEVGARVVVGVVVVLVICALTIDISTGCTGFFRQLCFFFFDLHFFFGARRTGRRPPGRPIRLHLLDIGTACNERIFDKIGGELIPFEVSGLMTGRWVYAKNL